MDRATLSPRQVKSENSCDFFCHQQSPPYSQTTKTMCFTVSWVDRPVRSATTTDFYFTAAALTYIPHFQGTARLSDYIAHLIPINRFAC